MKRKVEYLLTLAILALGAPVVTAETDTEVKKAEPKDLSSSSNVTSVNKKLQLFR